MKKRILACLLALVTLIGILPVTAISIDEEVPTVRMLDVSKSKTATALDANGQTQITLSLPSAEMKIRSTWYSLWIMRSRRIILSRQIRQRGWSNNLKDSARLEI